MNKDTAIEAFSALAQDSRLSIFKLLVKSEPNGLAVGQISKKLNIVPSTLSGHLSLLKRAGLLKATRHQREIHYSAKLDTVGELVNFVLENCCEGKLTDCLSNEGINVINISKQHSK